MPNVYLIRHRQPTLHIVMPIDIEDGASFKLYWNGHADQPAPFSAAIDYAAPLAGPFDIWPRGHPQQLFGGGFGEGGFGEPGGPEYPELGFGEGGVGDGPFGIGPSYFDWKFPFLLRDGDYRIATLVSDAYGNEQVATSEEIIIRVEAIPRPPTNHRIKSYDSIGLVLTTEWQQSPDFA